MRLKAVVPSRPPGRWQVGSLALMVSLSLGGELGAADRPSLVNIGTASPFGANGHSSTLDGRLFMGNVSEDHTNYATTWSVRVFRPESVTYDGYGKPVMTNAFSTGKKITVSNGENALAFCFADPTNPFSMVGANSRYTPYLFDSQMYNKADNSNASLYGVFRRRSVQVDVTSPFTTSADVSTVSLGGLETLTTSSGAYIKGIEPTMTSDGRLLIYQGGPKNDGAIDHIMYTYNANPCAATGWSTPRPISFMNSDTNPDLKARYALARTPLRAATGESFATTGTSNLVHGAYPWVDHEGRNVLYMGVVYTDGARREGATLLGADTNFASWLIDGALNGDRLDKAQLFYSGPMWNFEQERAPEQAYPAGTDNTAHYLPVTKSHDVLSLFGSNTADYNEVDVAELYNPFTVVYLPMNELVKLDGSYDLTRSPELSGRFYTTALKNGATIPASMSATLPANGDPRQPHSKGKALQLNGLGQALTVTLPLASGVNGVTTAVPGFTVQLAIKPDANLNSGCTGNPYRYLLQKNTGGLKPQGLDLIYEANNTVQMSFYIKGTRVRLGSSPPLTRGVWTNIAYTFDGATGTFQEYLNGVSTGRTLPTVAAGSTFALGNGTLYVGSGSALNSQSCPSSGEGSFVGYIDEVRLFSQTRSNRSVCLSVQGADCRDEAIQVDPSSVQFAVNQQWPTCDDSTDLNTLGCASAQHRLCAQRGAIDALDSTTNLANTVSQLISNRPPISLGGAPQAATSTTLTVACEPLENETLAVTYEELSRRYHAGCTSELVAMGTECSAAVHRFCNGLGWTTGMLVESTTRPWVSCFDSDWQGDVATSTLGTNCTSNVTTGACRLEIGQYCKNKGFGGGVLQEMPSGSTAHIHCFVPSTVATWKFKP